MFHDKASKNLNLPLISRGGGDIVVDKQAHTNT